MLVRALVVLFISISSLSSLFPQTFTDTPAKREARLKWWREARFGMFIHWGVYAVPAGEWKGKLIPGIGEWIMNRAKIPVAEYEKLAGQFNPVKFNADEWVRLAKAAGQKYIVITSKHHDGFAMFDSKVSDYDIVDRTPFKRDPMKDLAAACRREGIRLCFYYSQTQDWHHPNGDGNNWDYDESKKDFPKYLDELVKPQVREILTQYGPIGLIWFDTPRRMSREQSLELANLVHSIQPDCLVSGRIGNDMGDYQSTGDNQLPVRVLDYDWETPVTLNDTWGFKKDDHNWKSAQTLIRQLVDVVSKNGNYLLNVGPTAEGLIPQPSIDRLLEVGQWMKVNSEAVYGAQPSPFPYEFDWGSVTRKPGKLYLHLVDWPAGELVLYGLQTPVRAARLLADPGKSLAVKQAVEAGGLHVLRIQLPASPPDKNASVVALDLEGEARVEEGLVQQPDGKVILSPGLAEISQPAGGERFSVDIRGVTNRWLTAGGGLKWSFRALQAGEYQVQVVTCEARAPRGGDDWEGGHVLAVDVGGRKLEGLIEDGRRVLNNRNPRWRDVYTNLGQVRLQGPGSVTVQLAPKRIETAKGLGLTLRAVQLIPVRAGQQSPGRSGQGERQRPTSRRSTRVKMEPVDVASPDGKVTVSVLPNAERLTFAVKRDGATLIEPSPIVMILDGYDLSSGVVFGGAERYEMNESYPWHGMKSQAANQFKGLRISLTHDLSFTPYTLDVRVSNDAVAFRHVIPGKPEESRVPDEYSTFVLPAGTTVWYHDLSGHYESAYQKKEIQDIGPGEWAGPPVTFKLPGAGGYGAITEANLVDYSGMALVADGRRGLVTALGHRQPVNWPYELRYGREEAKRLGRAAAVSGTITTPWRVIMAAADLHTLVNSTIVTDLCPAPDPKYFPQGIKTEWVKPGRSVWRYVDGGDGSFEGLKGFSEQAGRLGFEYHILEGVWTRWTEEQIRDIVQYSAERGVRLLFWRHSNQLRTLEAREQFFSKLHSLGVAGAKIDFMDHEAKEIIDLYEELLSKAAQYQMVVDFHGANKPTGRDRTWPNELCREAVRGMESSSLRERARHETILPFTRYLAGPADYTTLHFGERRADTTWAHQIASFATFDSPLLTLAAHPQAVLSNPAASVIKDIPAVWDETIVGPASEIGELSVFARRSGEMWYLAVMCGPQGRTIQVPLAFLGDGPYKATFVRDDPAKDDAVVVEEKTAQRGDSVTIQMRNGGGFVARFKK
ncbi:MAG: alpha-L-fucosidase [Acidobacteriota bacterium]